MTHPNLPAYDQVEQLDRFTPRSFEEYCKDKLQSCDKHIAFIKEYCAVPKQKIKVLEVGCGNGKLLYRLEKEGLLEHGVGYEVSASRCRFAQEFGVWVQSNNVEIFNKDFMVELIPENSFDLVIGVDVVLNLIGAISQEHTELFLQKAISALRPSGKLVLELMTCQREIDFIMRSENGKYKTWKRFPESDPFVLGLDEIGLDDDGNLVWKKYFEKRSGGLDEGFVNIIKPFSEEEILMYATKARMQYRVFSSWAKPGDTSDQEFIVMMTS